MSSSYKCGAMLLIVVGSITKIEILISADLGRIMISKQTIDRTTVPPVKIQMISDDYHDLETFLAESFLHILGQSLEEDKISLESPGSRLWRAGRTGSSSSLIDRYTNGTLA